MITNLSPGTGEKLRVPVFLPSRDVLAAPAVGTNAAPLPWTQLAQTPVRNHSPAVESSLAIGGTVYAVDDKEDLTELYHLLLAGAGYTVRTFNDRAEALAVLVSSGQKPDLLITDYLGLRLPIEQFMRACRAVHPGLRILMATGLHPTDVRFTCASPDRFIRKPFTAEEFLREVRAALAG